MFRLYRLIFEKKEIEFVQSTVIEGEYFISLHKRSYVVETFFFYEHLIFLLTDCTIENVFSVPALVFLFIYILYVRNTFTEEKKT